MSTLPTSQKLYRISAFNDDVENLSLLTEEPIEQPKRKQVLVRLHAASLNYRDLLALNGAMGGSSGLIPLSDGAGEIVQLGQDVTSFQVGDRVAGTFFELWLDGRADNVATSRALGGGNVNGALQQYRVFEESGLVKIPHYLSYEQASTLPCAAVTAWNALFENGSRVEPNSTVLIIGTGGVSLFGLQLAKSAGAKVIVLSSSDEKLEKAKALGADYLVNYKQIPEWHVKVKELTNGQGVDHVIEVGGDGTLLKSLNSVRKGGDIHMIGLLTHSEQSNLSQTNLTLQLVNKLINLKGVCVGSRGSFERLNRTLEQHQIVPIVDKVFDFDKVKDAFKYMISAQHFGKIVIRID